MLVLRRRLSDPVFLLAVVAALGAFVVQSGELGSSDTTHRLQVAHSFWTSEPPVFPQEYPEFGLHGRGGKLQSWYGMGQSLLLRRPTSSALISNACRCSRVTRAMIPRF